ncbi:MAG: tRNA preQ1(34) S-adenosylmethionine ribosyltransferase-isomerase QueA [Pyrinomonadaceae bacterium]|nr:tRNA preQ1(34) S-adenosylmethionine ribosyltransferase-isomerase QueA [Pyrinomonadaceae bacterium]
MNISDFDYDLPEELIAQDPLRERSASRMLTVDRSNGGRTDARFYDLPKFIRKGDLVVLNNTKVFPARLFGKSETGANIEVFLVKETGEKIWETLARPARRLKPGKKIVFSEKLSAEVIEKNDEGKVLVKFDAVGEFDAILDDIGQTPLPPYIKRDQGDLDKDRERYQTVFAKSRGAIAAPTAGLHFTPEILNNVRNAGAEIAELTLHVGYGTFEPVRVDDLSEHRVMPERIEITDETADRLNRAIVEKRRIVAVGTTTTRALESSVEKGRIAAGKREAKLTVTPGYRFKIIGGLITNFHLPKSSLLVLVSTFGGHQTIMNAYRHAVENRYRFYSYGDCMFIF